MARNIPIIFSGPMVRALLDGRKTQTRRILKKRAALDALSVFGPSFLLLPGNVDLVRYAVGDRLWVRESWQAELRWEHTRPADIKAGSPIYFAFGDETVPSCAGRLRPSIHMPRWASRLTLVVQDVKVERLQDISEADALAEGCPAQTPEELAGMEARGWFRDLWDSINGDGAWDTNPWVVALTFAVHLSNIDAAPAAVAA